MKVANELKVPKVTRVTKVTRVPKVFTHQSGLESESHNS